MNQCQLIVAWVTAVLLLGGCVGSRLTNLAIRVGMEREKVESMIAEALNTENKYSPYGNNLSGGIVKYTDGSYILEIKYMAGAPAPYVKDAQGVVIHYPLIDETVESIKIYKK